MAFRGPSSKPPAAKPPASFNKPVAASKPAAKPAVSPIATNTAGSNPQRAVSPPASARGSASPTTQPRAPLEHKNSQVGFKDAKTKAQYGTIIRNWGNQSASKANLSMLEKKNLLPLVALHKNNNVKVQSVASEVIDSLVELPDGTISMEASKVNGFRPLVDLGKRDDVDAEVPILVLQSLAALAAHPACRAPIMNEIGWFNIPKFARAPEPDMKMACALLLGNSSHEPKNQKTIVEKGVPLLLENLKEATTTDLKASLYSALADISLIKDHGAQQIWDTSLLQYVVPSIKNDGAKDEQIVAVSLLANIVDTPNTTVHKEVIASGLVEKLYELLKLDVDELQSNIALVFARLGKSAVGRQKFETFPSFKKLLEILTSSKNPLTQFQVCGALDVLVDSDSIKQLLKKEDAVESLEEIILSTTVHPQVEELAMIVLKKLDGERWKLVEDKLQNTVKERPAVAIPIIVSPRSVETAEETLSFSPRGETDSTPRVVVAAPTPRSAAPTPRAAPAATPRSADTSSLKPAAARNANRNSVNMASPLQSLSFANPEMDAARLQKDHQLEVQKLNEEKKRLEELLKKEREAERESNKYAAASPGSNIDDKIKGSLKAIQDSIGLEVDLLGQERGKIEEWKRAIENYKGERIIYEKDLEIVRKDKDHLDKERGSFASDLQNLNADRERFEKERAAARAENDRVAQENARIKAEMDALAKAREKFERERSEYERERDLLAKGKSDQSAIDRERAERERQRAEEAEKAREKAEAELLRAEREKQEMEEMLEKERRRHKEELEKERRRLEEESEKAASAANAGREAAEREKALAEKDKYYEEIQLQFEKDKKRLEKEKAILEEELGRMREADGKSADEASKLSEFQRMLAALEETLEETRRTNKLLAGRVEQLEEELRNSNRDRGQSDEAAELAAERRRLEELARKLKQEQDELERAKLAKEDSSSSSDDDRELDLDERERKKLAADLKKLEEWERAKEKEKEENQKRLEEEIELLRLRHASWERKKAIVMADLIAKENEIFEREGNLNKLDDALYQREVRVQDLEGRPARRAQYSSSDESRDRTEITHSDRSNSDDDWTDDRTITESVVTDSDSDYTIDSPRRSRRSRDDDRDRERERERERERDREYDRERERERERERDKKRRSSLKASSPSRPKSTDGLKNSSALKASSGIRSSNGARASTPKARPPFADYLDPMEDGQMDDDEDDMFSVEGLAHSDPYEAARKLLALLELDPSRATESTMESVRKFAKNRSGAPSQYEARDIIPALIHILRMCTSPSHEEIILTCLLILAILAYNKDANQLYIRRAKGYEIFEIFLSFSLFTIQARSALTIAAYCLNNVPIKNEIGTSAVPKLVAMLKDASSAIRKSAAAALATLVDNNRYNKKIVKKLNGLKILLDLLKDNQIPPKYSLHLLASLAHESKKIKAQVPKHFPTVFRKIVLLLSPYTKAGVLSAAVAALMELARNNEKNQKEIFKAGATNYLVTILINKDRYNNDEMIANTLFLCWVIAKVAPKGLANPDFETEKWSMADILKSLKDINNEAVKKIIFQMENMSRTADSAPKSLGASQGSPALSSSGYSPARAPPTPSLPPPPSPALASSSSSAKRSSLNNSSPVVLNSSIAISPAQPSPTISVTGAS